MMMMMMSWAAVCDAIRRSGNAELNGLLDRYQRKLFSGYTTCWVRSARSYILRRATELGVVEEKEGQED